MKGTNIQLSLEELREIFIFYPATKYVTEF